MIPARGRILVRPADAAESYAGSSLIIPSEARERLTAHQVEVIAVGAFAECDPERSKAERKCERRHELFTNHERTCQPIYVEGSPHGLCDELHDCANRRGVMRVHPHNITVGSWLLVRPRSTIPGPSPERAEYFVHQDDVLGIFHNEISNATNSD